MIKIGGDIIATIKDVAAFCKVSVATVSRVLNDASTVTDETKNRVQLAIKQLNYSPNLLGRNLRRLETKKILVLLNTISNQFYSQVVKGIEEKAIPNGYTVMICMTHGDLNLEERFLQMLKTKLVDGAVFLTTEQSGTVLTSQLMGVNVVQACEPRDDFLTPIVSIDNKKAAFDAVDYLIRMGHREIAFLGAGNIYLSSTHREQGYKQALSYHGIPIDQKLIFSEGFSFNAGIRAASTLLNVKPFPTAIFCIADSSAAGAINMLAQNGIKTPDDVSVMGFDNTQLSEIYIPAITTVKQPQFEIGYNAMALLLDRINGVSHENTKIILDYNIVERNSVKERVELI